MHLFVIQAVYSNVWTKSMFRECIECLCCQSCSFISDFVSYQQKNYGNEFRYFIINIVADELLVS